MVDRYNSREVFKGGGFVADTKKSSCGCSTRRGFGNQSENRGYGYGDKKDCKNLLETLRKIDFSLIDTVLYLDAYPHSSEALAYYHKLRCERDMVVKTLAESCNMPQNSFSNASETQWLWTDSPWPWEACAN